MLLVFAILLIIILVVLVRCIVIVPQSNAYVTEWLGVYKDTWGAGLHIRTPFVERISRKVSLKEEADITSLMYYTGLNTGAYTLEASADGENWVSLWAKTDDGGKVESYYWADGTGYSPSKAAIWTSSTSLPVIFPSFW